MNTKISKLARDIEKLQARIIADQVRLEELERQKTELENVEIVTLFRSFDVTPRELATAIQTYIENGATPASTPKEALDDQANYD